MVKIKTVTEIIKEISGKDAESEHKLVYDSPTETLEPIYFFILDLMNDFGLAPEKLVDNFVSSPGSQHFGEMGQRASIMQQQGSKLLADINTVVRSILNLIYDLREFKIRLQSYEDLKNPSKKEGALLSLKQIWMDKVDMQKGNSGIKAMALGQAGFNTLIDAFLVAKNEKDIDDYVKYFLKLGCKVRVLYNNEISDKTKKRVKKKNWIKNNDNVFCQMPFYHLYILADGDIHFVMNNILYQLFLKNINLNLI